MNTIPRPEHPRPDFVRERWINLNGEWEFAFDDANAGIAQRWFEPGKHFDRRIAVPFCFQCKASGIHDTGKHETLWYRRALEIPGDMAGSRLLLRFGAVDFTCDVYVNGLRAGGHRGGYTPFAVDITDYVIDGENDLCVRVSDPYDCTQPRGKQNWLDHWFGCWYTPVSGIWQTVYLEAAGSPYLTGAHITPDLDAGTASLRLTLNEVPKQPVDAEITVSFEGQVCRRLSATLSQRSQRVVIDMVDGANIQGFFTWSPERPALYDVDISLSSGDRVGTYFGMRSIEVKDGWVLLNKRPLYQRLVLDQGYWPDTLLTPPSDEAIRADIDWTMKLGYNGARKHQKLEDPRYYYWADKLGLLVWGEIPSAYEFTGESVQNLEETLAGFIDRDFNHPCIVTWVPLNESWGVDRIYRDKRMQATANMLYDQAKAMDGTRLVSSNDGWELTKTDIFSLHDYAAEGDILARHFADRGQIERIACDHHMAYAEGVVPTGKEAFILTEYGGIAIQPKDGEEGAWGYHDMAKDEEDFFRRYAGQQDAVRAIPYCQGYCYTQLTDVQQEINGLLTPERKPKIDPERFAALTVNPEGRYF
ncbi:MAG: glycoside hydrolase family 2 [Clostridia bacterium]|nr:glycoside hydrolase family 2 [Clostridia bacterium]